GFGPPILGTIVGVAATRIGAPLTWWRTHLSGASLRFLAALWPWALVAGLIAWLSLLPGTILLDYFFGVSDLDVIVPILAFIVLSAFGFLLLTIFAGFAYDAQRQKSGNQEPLVTG
ncbi:MAG TPA: hypothetical protein VJ827_05930, partial [Rubrobacter sp.]|nr:hypothetical protein [Rubrobacter sp.]